MQSILIIHYLGKVSSLIVFPPNLVNFSHLLLKSTQILVIGFVLNRYWVIWKLLAAGFKSSLQWFGTLKFWQHLSV